MRKLLLLCFVCAVPLLAQNSGKISGRIVDAKTGEALPSVNVVVRGTSMGAATDIDGTYFILNVPPGVYDVAASAVGYRGIVQQKIIVNLSRTTTVDFVMVETVVEGEEVVITAERPDVEREKTSTSDIIRGEQVLAGPGIRDLESVIALSPDVVDGHFRGGRDGEELYTMAGISVTNPLDNALAIAPILSAVEEIEVITSGFSAKYGNAQSGVVNISLKEGNRKKWQARAEIRTRVPSQKHFGPSVWDPASNPYLNLQNSPEKMASMTDTSLRRLFLSDLISLAGLRPTGTADDTALGGRIAYAMYMQLRRDYGQSYSNLSDNQVELNTGGPLSDRTTLFIAGRYATSWPAIPPPTPDISRQLMGNLVIDLSDGMSLRVSGSLSNNDRHDYRAYGSTTSLDYRDWIWDRVIGLSKLIQDNYSLGTRLTYASSKNTFYEMKINTLLTQTREGPPVLSPDRYRTDDLHSSLFYPSGPTDNFLVGWMDNTNRDERTMTTSLDASVTSQVTRSHLLLAGIQLNVFKIDINNQTSRTTPGAATNQIYVARPFEGALFIEDKMEFEGMIANMGLRLDAYNQNVDYYSNVFNPLEGAPTNTTSTVTSLQPRIGISFPVSINTVFHVNYGSFLQRPSFQYTVAQNVNASNGTPSRLGNPTLKPQDTKSYDIGVMQALAEGFTVDLSGYYKDVSNLIERVYYVPANSILDRYETFVNRDYADIRGFRASLNKRKGMITGSLSYNYQVATGKSSTPFNASPTIREAPSVPPRKDDTPNPKDVLLDFDRTHSLVGMLGIETPEDFGFSLFNVYPLEKISISMKSFIRSGRPYTSPNDLTGSLFMERTPIERNTDFKLSKQIKNFFGSTATFYVEVFNVFNDRIYNYNTVFGNPINTTKFERDPSSLSLWVDEQTEPKGMYKWDVSFLIYDNMPRSVWCGVVINL